MSLSLLTFLTPKNGAFFSLFNQLAVNNMHISQLLYKAVSSQVPHEEKLYFNQINRLKTAGNDLKHQVYLRSSRALISPFERDDMYALASAVNQICDSTHVAARRISLYQLQFVFPAIPELAGLLIEATTELEHGVRLLSNFENAASIAECCQKVRQIENQADKVYNKALADVLLSQTSSIELIKYSEILASLELATDKCEDATDVIESIIVKNT